MSTNRKQQHWTIPTSSSSSSWKSFHRGFRPPNGGGTGGIPPYLWIVAGGSTVLLGYGYFAFLDEVPLTHRTRWIATSPQFEQQLGDEEYKKLIKQYRHDILPTNHRAHQTVQRVGSRVANAALEFAKQHDHNLAPKDNYYNNHTIDDEYTNRPYTYTVIRSDMANAFVLPGNHVFVMTGLFRYVHNEDELAAVLGHEVAHNLARHPGEKISGSLLLNLLARLSLLVDPSGLMVAILLPAATVFRELPHSRIQEVEADQIGIHLAAMACYDPRAAKRVFAAMKADEEQHSNNSSITSTTTTAAPPEFLSTHPSHDSRLTNFDKWMPDVMMVYNGDGGERCRHVREEMKRARQVAARNAAFIESQAAANTRKID